MQRYFKIPKKSRTTRFTDMLHFKSLNHKLIINLQNMRFKMTSKEIHTKYLMYWD